MSYKVDLSVSRGDKLSLTEQLVTRLAAAIDKGELAPGEKLPTTREVADAAGINHLTAARVYRRLAERGYVTASVGRGTFVRSLPPSPRTVDDDWQQVVLPKRLPSYRERIVKDLLTVGARADRIPLGAGVPAREALPATELAALTADVFAELGAQALAETEVEGLPALREELARYGRTLGFASAEDEILVTAGAHQALDLVVRTVLEPGQVAVVESPTFVGTLVSLEASGAQVIGIPLDENGIDVDALERVLARHEVKLVVLQPACQNPTGQHLSPERRRRLLELALERSFFVVEDAVYAPVRFEGDPFRSLRAEAPGHVIHVNSLSKTVAGGLRVGWVAAQGPVFGRLAALKMTTDLHTSSLAQHVAARHLSSGGYERLLTRTIPMYRERRDALLAALERHLPGEYATLRPLGGYNLWLTLRRKIDIRALYSEAVARGVSFTPGAVLMEESSRPSMRLSYSLAAPEAIDEGVRRLAAALRSLLRTDASRSSVPYS